MAISSCADEDVSFCVLCLYPSLTSLRRSEPKAPLLADKESRDRKRCPTICWWVVTLGYFASRLREGQMDPSGGKTRFLQVERTRPSTASRSPTKPLSKLFRNDGSFRPSSPLIALQPTCRCHSCSSRGASWMQSLCLGEGVLITSKY